MTATTWNVTLRTGDHTWSTIQLDAPTHEDAITEAQRLLGSFPCSNIE